VLTGSYLGHCEVMPEAMWHMFSEIRRVTSLQRSHGVSAGT